MPESNPHVVMPENAERFRDWLENRGGIAVWASVNMSNPGASWSTPALQPDGSPTPKPTWQAANQPARIITDMADVVVEVPKEVKRFHVAVRRSGNGLSLKLTDASSRKVEQAVARISRPSKAHPNGRSAWHVFDYMTQEAVILVADRTVPLTDWPDKTATQTPKKETA